MVQAIKSGKKKQTRRVMRDQPNLSDMAWDGEHWKKYYGPKIGYEIPECPFGGPGDLIYVREAFMKIPDPQEAEKELVVYRADLFDKDLDMVREYGYKWVSGMRMPKDVARIWLEIQSYKVQSIQEISLREILAEGISGSLLGYGDMSEHDAEQLAKNQIGKRFQATWNFLNEKRGFSWKANPWVFAITFKVVDRSEMVRVAKLTFGKEPVIQPGLL